MKKFQRKQQEKANEWKVRGFGKSSTALNNESEPSESTTNHRETSFSNRNPHRKNPRDVGDMSSAVVHPVEKLEVANDQQHSVQSQETSDQKIQNNTVKPEDQKRKRGQGNQKGKKPKLTNSVSNKDNPEASVEPSKPKRKKQKFQGYTLFIGNLSYDTTTEDIQKHFAKCGPVKSVRIPVDKTTNQPRGFGYLEVEDHVTYEKVLSLHHSFLKKRRINVECTFGGSGKSQKRKALIKEKTLKLRFLSREGKISSAKQRPWGKPKTTPSNQ